MEVGGEINYQVIYRADNQEAKPGSCKCKSSWSSPATIAAGGNIYAGKSNVEHTPWRLSTAGN